MDAEAPELGKIPQAFEAYFRHPQVHFPSKFQSTGGEIHESGWDIRYVLGHDSNGTFIELYAINRRTSDRHIRIGADGSVETLPAVSESFNFDPNIPGDRERAKRQQQADDAPVIADLKRKGLL